MTAYTRNPQTIPDDSVNGSSVREGVADENSKAIDDLFTDLNVHSNNEDGNSHDQIDTKLAALEESTATLVPQAETARDEALAAQVGAEESKIAAQSAELKAGEWAEKSVDVEVEPGKFSAKHHAEKAAASAESIPDKVLAADSPDLLEAVYGDQAQTHVGTDLSGLTVERNHIKWTLTADSTFSDVVLPYDGTYIFHVYPASHKLSAATSYKTDDMYISPKSSAGEIRIVIEQYNSRKSIISLQNMGA